MASSSKSAPKKTTVKKSPTTPKISGSGPQLVIVESPAKARTIGKFLGSKFVVKASMGHIAELADKNMAKLVKNNFEPTYEIIENKTKVIRELQSDAKKSAQVWIATDEDREGEAIGWHITQALKLDPKSTPRIVFHEITKSALEHALEHPRRLDMKLINAQQGRSVLDKLIGFSVSPLLWKKVASGLSAGRVQSVAVKMIVQREEEIKAFKPEESWKVMALLADKKQEIPLELTTIQKKKVDLKNKEEVLDVMQELFENPSKTAQQSEDEKSKAIILQWNKAVPFQLMGIETSQGTKNPAAPFTTSTLQQTASRMFGRGVKQVMSVAQKLYENGMITYMRTDSVALSDQALGNLKTLITKEYGDKYYQFRKYAQKSKNAQEAHEAIRPTHADRTPGKSGLSAQELKLYDLIWRRTVASQMKSAQVEYTNYVFQPLDTKNKPIAQQREVKGQLIRFEGFLKVATYQKAEDIILPELKEKTVLNSQHIDGYQQFSKPPARYTEATLVKALETKGIGRPSTYAPTISTIQDRGYVIKEENKLKPTDIAFVVIQYLEKHFVDLMNYEFTAHLENKLDDIAQGDLEWKRMLADFYAGFHKHLEKADQTEKELVSTGEKCPQCKQGELVMRFGRAGKFIACSRYPDCTYTKQPQDVEDKLASIKAKYEGKPCEAGGTIVVRMGRFGPFLASSLYPEVKWIGKIPDEKLEEMNKQYGGAACPTCKQGKLVVKKSNARGRPSYFLGCNRYPDCRHLESLPGEKGEKTTTKKVPTKISKKIGAKKNTVKKVTKTKK